MTKKSKKLEKILENHIEDFEGREINELLLRKIRQGLINDGRADRANMYDPVVELAKLANNPGIEESLKFQCNKEVAAYLYPKVKSQEARKSADTELKVIIEVANYAVASQPEIPADNIDLEDKKQIDFLEPVLDREKMN